jgi:hypothetical protein
MDTMSVWGSLTYEGPIVSSNYLAIEYCLETSAHDIKLQGIDELLDNFDFDFEIVSISHPSYEHNVIGQQGTHLSINSANLSQLELFSKLLCRNKIGCSELVVFLF